MLCTWFYEHPYCTDSDILFLLLLTNLLIVGLLLDKSFCQMPEMEMETQGEHAEDRLRWQEENL